MLVENIDGDGINMIIIRHSWYLVVTDAIVLLSFSDSENYL